MTTLCTSDFNIATTAVKQTAQLFTKLCSRIFKLYDFCIIRNSFQNYFIKYFFKLFEFLFGNLLMFI